MTLSRFKKYWKLLWIRFRTIGHAEPLSPERINWKLLQDEITVPVFDDTGFEFESTWAVCLIVGFPALMLLLGEVAQRLQRRGHGLAVPIRHLHFIVLPSLAIYLLLTKVAGFSSQSIAPGCR